MCPIALLDTHHRPEANLFRCGIANTYVSRARADLLDKLGHYGFLHEHAPGGHADLPLMQVRSPSGVGRGEIHVRIVQDDQGILATELERDLLQVLASQCADAAARPCGSRELDHGDVRIDTERLPRLSLSGQDMKQICRQACNLKQTRENEPTGHRGAQIGFQNDRVTESQCRC